VLSTPRSANQVVAVESRVLLLRLPSGRSWPEQRLTDDYLFPADRRYGRAVEAIAERKRLAHSAAERVVIRPGKQSVSRQPVGGIFRHGQIVSHPLSEVLASASVFGGYARLRVHWRVLCVSDEVSSRQRLGRTATSAREA
jgi:hypothetical protein